MILFYMSLNRFPRKELYVVLILLILTSLFFWTVLANPGKMMYSKYSDITSPFTPWKQFVSDSVWGYGELPLWDPNAYGGTPFIGNVQATMFYPLFLPLLFLPVSIGFGYIFMLHIFLAGFFMYLFVKYLGVGRFGSLVAGITFMFTGNLVVKLYSAQIINVTTIAWIPLVFLSLEVALRKGSLRYGLLTGVFLALQFFSGQGQIFLYTSFALFLFFLYRLYFIRKEGKGFTKAVGVFVAAAAIAASLSAVQLLPVLEISEHFYRAGGVSYEFATDFYSIAPEQLVTLFAPEFFGSSLGDTYQGVGNFWESTFYTGILPLLLAMLAVFFKRNRYTVFFLALAVFGMLFSFGRYTPFFSIFYYLVPGFDLFRQPGKMLIIFSFSIAVLSGYGASFLMGKFEKKWVRRIAKIILILTVFAVAAAAAAVLFGEEIISLGKGIVSERFAEHVGPEFTLEYYRGLIETIYWGIVNNLIVLSGLLASITVLLFLRLRGFNKKYLKIIIIIIILADLWIFGFKYIDVTEPENVFVRNDIHNFLEGDTSLYRVLDLNNTFPAHLAYPSGIQLVQGHDPVPLRDYVEYEYSIINFTLSSLCKGCYPPLLVDCSRGCYFQLLDILNVKYVVTTEELDVEGFELRYEGLVEYGSEIPPKYVYVYENEQVLPRVFFVPNHVVKERGEILETLKAGIDYRNYVILEEEAPGNGEGGEAEIVYYSPNRVEVKAEGSGFLVFSDVWYPGWKAYVNGEEVKIYRADYIFKAVYLEGGDHTVEFVFEPQSYWTGVDITLITLVFLVIVFLIFRFKKPKRTIKQLTEFIEKEVSP
jgi:hypothetical protein